MDRRKFLTAMGSLAAGSAAALGTGAFTSVTAERDATVKVAGDGQAYIKLVPGNDNGTPSNPSGPNAAYADYNDDGELELNFDDMASGVGGDGANPNAVTDVDEVFYIANQGTQDVGVWIEDSGSDAVTFYAHNRHPNNGGSESAPNGSLGNAEAAGSDRKDDHSIEKNGGSFDVGAVTMSPGDTMEVSVEIDTTDISSSTQILDSITIFADTQEAQ
jgi:hypothetical protein